MLPTKSLRFVNTLQIIIAVCGLQLYAQSLDSRTPLSEAARAAVTKMAATQSDTVRQALTIPPPTAVGTFVTFDVPGAVNGTFPASINNSGAITGHYFDNVDSGLHGFIRAANGTFVRFDVPLVGSISLLGQIEPITNLKVQPLGLPGGDVIPGYGLVHSFIPGPPNQTHPFDPINADPHGITNFRGTTAMDKNSRRPIHLDGASTSVPAYTFNGPWLGVLRDNDGAAASLNVSIVGH